MSLPEPADPSPPLRKSAQRLRWFVGAFEEQVSRTETETGNQYAVDRGTLAQVFADWIRAFEGQKPERDEDKPAYVGFAAGLMLRSLISLKPVRVTTKPSNADDNNPAYFWPEGYLYVAFCLNVRGLVLESDFATGQEPSETLDELRTWWSFRENVAETPSLAIAFLDLFAGEDPDWTFPQIFRPDNIGAIADRFYQKRQVTEQDD